MNQFLKPILESSYQKSKVAKNTLEKAGLKLDRDLSNKEAKVFIDEEGKPNIAFRGSASARDFLISDPLLALGLSRFDPRLKRTQELTKKVEEKYKQPVNVFGHSLAGHLSEKSGASGNITTFNKGASPYTLGMRIPDRQTDIRTSGDIVSLFSIKQRGGIKETIDQMNPLKAHGLENLKR